MGRKKLEHLLVALDKAAQLGVPPIAPGTEVDVLSHDHWKKGVVKAMNAEWLVLQDEDDHTVYIRMSNVTLIEDPEDDD